ncbi:hypothetical protein Ahy_A09g046696 [Arachis hypogaea]|uniref:SWIM-type domain-containing protein n=1 Tax=Arachis hypogaea TaxID=3818 RepID=A0A445BQJ0_ARAHY|nr:hypothetical protein Ahy_A09g046696 [Arachis hypogaea]
MYFIQISIPVFGGFVQFETKYVTNEASMQDMFSMYIKSRAQISFIELYIEFEQSEADRNIVREDYNIDCKEEFESNYEIVGLDGDEDQGNGTVAPNVTDVANALANEVPFEEPSFMRVLDLEAMHVLEFPEYMSVEISIVADGEFAVGMEFNFREAVIKAMKEYTIRRSVDYWVYESEPLTFYAKCTQYGSGCDWLIRNEVFELREMQSGLEYAVDLRRHRCDCGKFQVDRIPCRHMDQVRRVYRARFKQLENPTTWPAYNGPRFVPNPYLRRVTKGRPKMTRFLNEMDTQMLRSPRRCRQCGVEEHSCRRCPRSAGAAAENNAQ